MLTRTIHHKNSAIGARAVKFGLAIKASPPLLSNANQMFFLCGANRSVGLPSARREAIKKFIETQSASYRVIYAENVFNEILELGHQKNILDLEHDISEIADKVIIVLESPSAFCELGAFAHVSHREKLIIINDSAFKDQKSFINIGPIAAASEAKGFILWYPMSSSTDYGTLDGIGKTFKNINDAITSTISHRSIRITEDLSNLSRNKISLYFIHDLIMFAGPISYKELISLLIAAFGHKNYDLLKPLLGVLRATDIIKSYTSDGTKIYRSLLYKPFMNYGISMDSFIATFRKFHLRINPARFTDG